MNEREARPRQNEQALARKLDELLGCGGGGTVNVYRVIRPGTSACGPLLGTQQYQASRDNLAQAEPPFARPDRAAHPGAGIGSAS